MRIGHRSQSRYIAALLIAGATLALAGGTRLRAQENTSKESSQTNNTEHTTTIDQAAPTHTSTQLYADILFLQVPTKLLAEIQLDPGPQSVISGRRRKANGSFKAQHTSRVVTASGLSRATEPSSLRQLNDEQHQRVLEWTLPASDAGVMVEARRTTMTRSGAPATFFSGDVVPIIAGFDHKAGKPKFTQREIGLRYAITATLGEEAGQVDLDCSFSNSELVKQSAEEKKRAVSITINGKKHQSPVIKAHTTNFEMKVPVRSAVACVTGCERREGAEFATVFVVSVSPAGNRKN